MIWRYVRRHPELRAMARAALWCVIGSAIGSTIGSTIGCTAAPGAEPTQTITFKLDFGGGVMLTSVDYVLRGPGQFTQIGTMTLGDQDTISATLSNLPAGNGYTITVRGAATDGFSQCQGNATFNVTASMTAVVQIPLQCSGIAKVSADFSLCPRIDSLSAVPAEVLVGSSMAFTLAAHDPDNGPGPLTATWAASTGSLTNLSTTGATFTCTAPGTFMITVRVSDGNPIAQCADTAALTVTCSAP